MVSIIIPTYNEKDNLPALVKEIFQQLGQKAIEGEVIIVDDNSPDGTSEVVLELAKSYNIRLVKRAGKLGLSSAVVEGFTQARGDILGVMDADLSHDPSIIPQLVRHIKEGNAQLAIGSRYIKGGNIKNWPFSRKLVSQVAICLAVPLTRVKDITSGYFFLRKDVINGVALNNRGFKIGLEVIVKGNYKNVSEVPFTFVDRQKGKSKFSTGEIINYLLQLKDLYFYKFFCSASKDRKS